MSAKASAAKWRISWRLGEAMAAKAKSGEENQSPRKARRLGCGS